jgi:hypothetical protein
MYNWEILTKETINEKRKKGVEGGITNNQANLLILEHNKLIHRKDK